MYHKNKKKLEEETRIKS